MSARHILLRILSVLSLTAALLLAVAGGAAAKSYDDVAKSHWAFSYI
jgi:hypothetical protein